VVERREASPLFHIRKAPFEEAISFSDEIHLKRLENEKFQLKLIVFCERKCAQS